MALVVWACPLVVYHEASLPKVVQVLDSVGPHETSWSTTPGSRAAPYAVGCSAVSAAQLSALEADTAIHLWGEADWSTQFNDLPAGVRNRLNQFCTTVGVTRPQTNEVVRDILSRMVQLLDNKLLEEHVMQVHRQQGA